MSKHDVTSCMRLKKCIWITTCHHSMIWHSAGLERMVWHKRDSHPWLYVLPLEGFWQKDSSIHQDLWCSIRPFLLVVALTVTTKLHRSRTQSDYETRGARMAARTGNFHRRNSVLWFSSGHVANSSPPSWWRHTHTHARTHTHRHRQTQLGTLETHSAQQHDGFVLGKPSGKWQQTLISLTAETLMPGQVSFPSELCATHTSSLQGLVDCWAHVLLPWPSYLHDTFTTDLTPLVPILTRRIPSFINSNSFHVCLYYISPSSLSPMEWSFLLKRSKQNSFGQSAFFHSTKMSQPPQSLFQNDVKWWLWQTRGAYSIASPSIAGTSLHPGWI